MKKLLLVISIVGFGLTNATAQCTPDITAPAPNYADSTFGAWPDTVINFAAATVGVPYTQELQFKVPTDAGVVVAALAGNPITSFTVDDVTGLPAGLSYACNIASCVFNGGTVGCALISGTCTTPGTYSISIDVTGSISVFGFPTTAPYQFVGYKIIVGQAGVVEAIINPISIHPNPATNEITLDGLNAQMKITAVNIKNMEGKLMKNVPVTSSSMTVSLDGFESGVYFVEVSHAGGNATLKFIKE